MLWRLRTSPPGRITSPVGFVLPCQPTLAVRPPPGPGWIHEVKHDGYRIVARKNGPSVRLWSRQAVDYTAHFSGISAAISALPGETITLDGEAIVLRDDGHSDFEALRSRGGGSRAILVVFDILELEGQDLRRRPLEERRDHLTGLLARSPPAIVMSQAIEGDGERVFEHACRLGCEGIISKRRGSTYRSGRSRNWFKIKSPGYCRITDPAISDEYQS